MENKQNPEPVRNINIQNNIFGDIRAENFQNGDYTSIMKHNVLEKKKKGFPRILEIVYTIFKRLLIGGW
jgi:hypothetical protein